MGNITVKFIGKEYSIPKDVLTYIELLDFTDSVQKQLISAFICKLKNKIAKDNIGLLGDEDLTSEIEQQIGKFIAKLCDNGIFSRTINDYLMNNKGYQLYSDVNKSALEKMKSILIQEMDAWQAGYENAVNKAESNITGMGFSIWSGSFVNHAIYAAMEASTINKQEKEAQAQYRKDMNELSSRLESQFGGEKSNYINNTYIPNIEAALTVFAYELLDKYVADLIANGKFDSKTLDYVDIGRSNDLLKNLTLSNNKQAILENAFSACPYNVAVYMQAMKYELLDYESFQTAKFFKRDDAILSFLRRNWGEVAFPIKFNITYHCVELLALFTEKNTTDLLRSRTEQYATGVVKAYSRVADMLNDKELCLKIIREFDDNSILRSDAISKNKAHTYVDHIITPAIWNQLVDKCGQVDLLKRIKAFVPEDIQIGTKQDVDAYFVDQLTLKFEEARQTVIVNINAKRAAEEKRRVEQERLKAEKERVRQEKRAKRKVAFKKSVKISAIVAAIITALVIIVSLALLFINNVIVPANKYNDAVALMDSGEWLKARDLLESLDDYKDSEDLLEQCNSKILEANYNSAVQLMNEKKYEDASKLFEELASYKDSEELLKECKYQYAIQLMYDEKYTDAINAFGVLDDYKDSKELQVESKYQYALCLIEDADFYQALEYLETIQGYKDASERAKESYYKQAINKKDNKLYLEAAALFEKLGNYNDSTENAKECRYIAAKKYVDSYDYDAAKNQFVSISDYKDSATYVKLIDNIISKIYYNDEYRGTHYIWVVSRIDTESCSDVLNFYECRDDIGIDDDFVDYYQGHNVQWKASGTKIFASSNGKAVENGYTLYTLSTGRNIITSQYISTDGEAKVTDTYKLMPDGRAQYIKEEWLSYIKSNEGDDTWKTAEATVDIIDDDSSVRKTADGIEFSVNGLKWYMPNGWEAKLNADATVALVTFSEGDFWGDTDRIYISYEGQYSNMAEYMDRNKTNGTFNRINVVGCSEAYVCYEGLLDENDFESNTAYVICKGSVFKVSYVADDGWYNETQVKGALSGADFSSYSPNN